MIDGSTGHGWGGELFDRANLPVCQQRLERKRCSLEERNDNGFKSGNIRDGARWRFIMLLVWGRKRCVFGFIIYLEARTEQEGHKTRDLAVSGKAEVIFHPISSQHLRYSV